MNPSVNHKSAVLIAGPTASGKSALAIRMARERGGVIINADSMQVYAELRIISARPPVEDEQEVTHRLYGHVSGGDDYSVARWLSEAKNAMDQTWAEGRLPIVVGGTGLYFSALGRGLADIPPIEAAVREKWRLAVGDIHAELCKRDAAAAAKLNPADRQRVVRALEVIESTGKSITQWQKEAADTSFLNNINVERLFVEVPREVLYTRADRRFDQMLAAGALDEVKALPPWPAERPMMKAIGVPELLSHLRGEVSLEQAVVAAKTATRHYIKRQTTWWRGQMADWTACAP